MSRECSTHELEEKCIESVGGKARGKISLGRQRNKCVVHIKINLKEI
jgi:hypothetical protein